MVQYFFVGNTLPKFITHISLVLLSKNNQVNTFADLRLISLSNFINKILSRVIHDRLEGMFP